MFTPQCHWRDHQLRIGLQTFCDDLIGTLHTQHLRAAGIVSQVRCKTYNSTTSVFQMGMGVFSPVCLPLHFLSMFCSAHSSPLIHVPALVWLPCSLVPRGSFISSPPIFYSSASVLLWLCPSLVLPLCPCDSHGLAMPSAPSHFLLLPLPSLTLLLSLQTETPLSIFPPL